MVVPRENANGRARDRAPTGSRLEYPLGALFHGAVPTWFDFAFVVLSSELVLQLFVAGDDD